MVLEEFIADIQEKFDPEEINITAKGITFDGVNTFFDFDIYLEEYENDRIERVRLNAYNYRASKIVNNVFSTIDLSTDHPLLWNYNDLQASLYFNGIAKDYYELFWQLNKGHKRIFDEFLPMDEFVNRDIIGRETFETQFGLLAKGPKKLMLGYAECLEKQNVRYSFANENEPLLWIEDKLVRGFRYPKVIMLESSYIIADNFSMERRT